MSVDQNGNAFNVPRTAVYKYGDCVMVSFEDFTTDENFSDVVVALKSNPVDAITEIPEVNPLTKVSINKGVYAFEDLWPSAGDYDMNDIITTCDYTKVFDRSGKIHTETYDFKTYQNVATIISGLAVRVNGDTPTSVNLYVKAKGADTYEKKTVSSNANVYYLESDVKANIGSEYRLELVYTAGSYASKESVAQPFVYRQLSSGKLWEVHIPYEAPTSLMDLSLFGINDDKSKVDEGVYYVRSGSYPFALFLSGAKVADISKLLDSNNERKAIDVLYPSYKSWVESNGATDNDWYKK